MNSMIRNLAIVAFSVTAFTSAQAASDTAERAESQYKAAMERCEPLKGNAQDVCEKDAKAARDRAKAEYDAAKERCESLKGKEQDACESKAKASLDRRQADADKKRRTN